MHGRPRARAEGRAHVALPRALRRGDRRGRVGEALLVEELAEHIAHHIVERQGALRAEVRIAARWPVRRTTPVTGSRRRRWSRCRHRGGDGAGTRRVVGVEATGINACPCAQGLVRGRARSGCSRRATRTSSGSSSSCRSRPTTSAAGGRSTSARNGSSTRKTSSGSSSSMSAPVYELLKRPDELFVVEHAHLRPRFVEDSVRIALGTRSTRCRARGRRLRLLAPAQPRDDPRPRRRRRALGHGRRAAGASSRSGDAARAPHAARATGSGV